MSVYDNQTLLIIGAGGQDAFLLAQKYANSRNQIIGVRNPHSQIAFPQKFSQNKYYNKVFSLDLASWPTCIDFLDSIKPNRIIHAAAVHANSSIMNSFATMNLERIRMTSIQIVEHVLSWQSKNTYCKSLFLNSSQIFGESQGVVDSNYPHFPQNQYAKHKSLAFILIKDFQSLGIDARSAILFPHTSPFSTKQFLFQEIAKQICIEQSSPKVIRLVNSLKSLDISDARDMACWLYDFFESDSFGLNCVFGSGKLFKIRDIIFDALEMMNRQDFRIEDIAPEETRTCRASTAEMLRFLPEWRIGRLPSLTLVDIIRFFSKQI